jgi:uncharacterized protein YciI
MMETNMMATIAAVLALTAQLPDGMTTYQLVVLKKGPAYTTDPVAAKKVLDQHVAYMMKLGAEGQSLAAGPCTDDGEIAGLMLLRAGSVEKARQIEEADPAVKAGHFAFDVGPFAAASDAFHPWAQPFGQETVYFGFLNTGPNRGQDAQTAAALQKQHLAFMEGQHEQGRLLVAGPFVEPGPRRGLVVYRAGTLEEALSRASADPMIKAGRLALELHPWVVPKGAM